MHAGVQICSRHPLRENLSARSISFLLECPLELKLKIHNLMAVLYNNLKRFAQKKVLCKVARQPLFHFFVFGFLGVATAANASLLRFFSARMLFFFA